MIGEGVLPGNVMVEEEEEEEEEKMCMCVGKGGR